MADNSIVQVEDFEGAKVALIRVYDTLININKIQTSANKKDEENRTAYVRAMKITLIIQIENIVKFAEADFKKRGIKEKTLEYMKLYKELPRLLNDLKKDITQYLELLLVKNTTESQYAARTKFEYIVGHSANRTDRLPLVIRLTLLSNVSESLRETG